MCGRVESLRGFTCTVKLNSWLIIITSLKLIRFPRIGTRLREIIGVLRDLLLGNEFRPAESAKVCFARIKFSAILASDHFSYTLKYE